MVFSVIFGALAFVVGLIIFSSLILLRGYVLSILWRWFMVPTLGLPQLSVVQAIGIAMVVSFLTYHDDLDLQRSERSLGQKTVIFLCRIIYLLFALLFGWVVHQFM